MKMKPVLFYTLITTILLGFGCQQNIGTKNTKLVTDADSASYAIGVLIGANNKDNLESAPGGKDLNTDIIIEAFIAYMHGEETKMETDAANQVIRDYFQKASDVEGQKNLEEGNAFLEENKAKEGIQITESGLQYEVLKEGDGAKPVETDQVKVHYHGTLIDGTVFDSSIDRGEPTTFQVNRFVPGWIEGLQLMSIGAKYKFYIPTDLAYGANPRPGGVIKPNMALIFEIELLEIIKAE